MQHRYDPHGFQLGDGVDVRGSIVCMPNSFVLWEPKTPSEITIESLRILELVIPKIGIAYLGADFMRMSLVNIAPCGTLWLGTPTFVYFLSTEAVPLMFVLRLGIAQRRAKPRQQ